MRKNLLDLDLQYFADEVEDAGENDVADVADPQEDEEISDDETVESSEEDEGDAEPQQTAEENAQFAAIRRRERDNARRELEAERRKDAEMLNALNQQAAALCNGAVNPNTGAPITNVYEYFEALQAQRRMDQERELQQKGVDPRLIDQRVASHPAVLQAQHYAQQIKEMEQEKEIINAIEEIGKLDPNVKTAEDLYNAPYRQEIIEYSRQHNVSLLDAYKLTQFDSLLASRDDSSRQKAINQMKGKSHLPSQTQSIATENDDIEVPASIMASQKADGKTEKEIRESYRRIAKKLHLN